MHSHTLLYYLVIFNTWSFGFVHQGLASGSLVPGHVSLCAPLLRCMAAMLIGADVYAKSPHVRAKIGDLFHDMFFRDSSEANAGGRQFPVPMLPVSMFDNDPFLTSALLPGLIEVYGKAAEETGFYESTRHRIKLSVVIKYLLSLPAHRTALVSLAATGGGGLAPAPAISASSSSSSSGGAESKDDSAAARPLRRFDFVSSANGLMNQANSAITDSMGKLGEILQHQQRVKDVAAWSQLSAEDRTSAEEGHERVVQSCRGSLAQANQSLEMLALLTGFIRESFASTVLLRQLAATLMTLLRKIVDDQDSIKVDNKEAYGFEPKQMLRLVVKTTLNLVMGLGESSGAEEDNSDAAAFCAAVAEFFSEGSDVTVLDRTAKIMRKRAIMRADDFAGDGLALWSALATRVQGEVQRLEAENEALGEAPEEFECALLCTLMKDPVKLPCGTVVDRSSIMQQLLNVGKNPFTNLPMTVEDLVPLPELKARIAAWQQGKKGPAS
jgi:hypothetical protein